MTVNNETPDERNDREWTEMLQELRVIQTGTQILGGFLLAVAFQPRFQELDGFQLAIYLALVVMAVTATILALTPMSLHRALFRQHAKDRIVRTTNWIIVGVLTVVGATLAGTALLIVDLVVGRAPGLIVGSAVAAIIASAWLVFPVAQRARRSRPNRR